MASATTSTPGADAAAALEALPPGQAAALLLAARPGVTYRDVAAKLGVEPAVALRWISEGLRSMRTAGPGTSGVAWT